MSLASLLPLARFRTTTLDADALLHHCGHFNMDNHSLDRPIWVSEDLACAKQYINFASHAPFYTQFAAKRPFSVVELRDVSLMALCQQLGAPHHRDWNRMLADHLITNGVDALIYCGDEMLIADPASCIAPLASKPSSVLRSSLGMS